MLSQLQMQAILDMALSKGGDFAELFFEDTHENSVIGKSADIKKISSVHIYGAGIYVLSGTSSAYVYTNQLSYANLIKAAKKAAALLPILKKAGKQSVQLCMEQYPTPNPIQMKPSTVSMKEKVELVKESSTMAGGLSPYIQSMEATYFDKEQQIIVVNSEGLLTTDHRVSSRLRFSGVVENHLGVDSFWGDYTRAAGFEAYHNPELYRNVARELVNSTLIGLEGKSIKSGVYPVVMEAGACGTLWHEACGHPLESVAISENSSEFVGMLGKRVASDKVTLVDDGTIQGMYGSAAIDDEGAQTRKNILIEDGILKGYLCDRLGGRRLGMESTGNGRRQSYAYAPVARMTNTYLAAGNDEEDEMIGSIDRGIFVKSIGGGYGGREFSLEVQEGYFIEHGKITSPIKGLTLTGKGMDVITKIDRVGKNLVPEGGSFCGASSGLCSVTSYQPRIRISEMQIGGEC